VPAEFRLLLLQPRDASLETRLTAIHLNGEVREVPDGLTVATLLEWLKLSPDRVAVERNLEIVARDRWKDTPIQAGDRLEVVHFVGGGSGPSGVGNLRHACGSRGVDGDPRPR